MKQFVKVLDNKSAAFRYLQDFFPKQISKPIKKILEWNKFSKLVTSKENAAWKRFIAVVRGFLGNQKVEVYVELVEILVKNYDKMG
ncbi:hypothetical protein J437_LFUL010015 [Ladona fulva]|uniref:Uncharacterized protein n=1 Tax=Ladona fulva TaxID=123851 RepID=A0A8K0KBB1_LADFU|nr:hypothetical protein J437_LFUL010015 [Ladona fulva]